MMAVWVKICGVTNLDDARAAWDAGADAVGLNFVAGPRKIAPAQAVPILKARRLDRTVVALVELRGGAIDPVLSEMLTNHGVRHLQAYGEITLETITELAAKGWSPIIVCRTSPKCMASDVAPWLEDPRTAAAFAMLVDALEADHLGGTGSTLDWSEVGAIRDALAQQGAPPMILAGGLTVDNVGHAVAMARPWGVDVSSGVELGPGRKDHRAVAAFVRAAKASP